MRICTLSFRHVFPVAMLFLTGCNGDVFARPNEVIQHDLKNLYSGQEILTLTLPEAIQRALEYNLDAKIAQQDFAVSLSDAELQKLNALPTITAQEAFITRTNNGASSSVSALTGVQSLEPSISTDRSRFTSLLEANWNVLDSAISIYRSKSAIDRSIIAQERLRRVQQNIVGDVTSAFLRAAIAYKSMASVEKRLSRSKQKLDVLDQIKLSGDLSFEDILSLQSDILNRRQRLQEQYQALKLAGFELRALLSLEPNQPLKLQVPNNWTSAEQLSRTHLSTELYIEQALQNRPELREELLNLRIAQRELKTTIYETFPGLNILVTGNSDNNDFLADSRFGTLSATLSQSITRLLTLPARRKKAQKDIDLADARRKALIAAIISQVYIGKTLSDVSYQNYIEHLRAYNVARERYQRSVNFKDQGLLSTLDHVRAELDFEIAKLERFDFFLQVHQANTRLNSALGEDYNAEKLSGYAKQNNTKSLISYE